MCGLYTAVKDCSKAGAEKLETDERPSWHILAGDKSDQNELDPKYLLETGFTSAPEVGKCHVLGGHTSPRLVFSRAFRDASFVRSRISASLA